MPLTPNPIRLTSPEAAKLPRWALWLVLAAYAIPGLLGRDPWRTDDAIGLGVMWTMAHGSWADWLMPNVAGASHFEDGPLFFWLGAVLIRLFDGWVAADEVARLATLLAVLLAGWSLWYGVYLLGRRSEIQPQALAFGGQPHPIDFGRAIADGALLVSIATLGLLVRAHESATEIAQFALLCLALYGEARSLDRPVSGALTVGVAAGALCLVRGPAVALVPIVTAGALVLAVPAWRTLGARWWVTIVLVAAVVVIPWAWAVVALPGGAAHLAGWWAEQRIGPWAFSAATWLYYFKNLPWFLWPAWPLAMWAVWTWRRAPRPPQIAMPLVAFGVALVFLGGGEGTSDTAMLVSVPPLVVLAAFAMPVVRRGTANLIDWFAVMVFSLFGLAVWFGWSVLMTGAPGQVARNAARAAPGFVAHFDPLMVAMAVAATLAWAALVRWRIFKRPQAVWRSVVLSAAGLSLIWALFMTLLMPYIDYRKSYRTVSAQVRAQVPVGACVQEIGLGTGLGLAQRASLAYFDQIEFAPRCPYLLTYRGATHAPIAVDAEVWTLIWQGRRSSDRHENFMLYRRDTVAGAGS